MCLRGAAVRLRLNGTYHIFMPSKILKKKKKVAIFDIDGTIFRSSLLIEFNKGLMRTGVIPSALVGDLHKEYFAWVERKGSYGDYIRKVVTMHQKAIKGKEQKYVIAAADLVFLAHRDRVYRYTRDLLKKLKRTHLLLAISGSPLEIVTPFAKYFDFDHVWGTVYEVDRKGVYTGRVLDRRSVDHKREILEAFVQEQNLSLKDSWGVGDTETDISILEVVDHPIAFNPTASFYNMAKKKKWPVIVERKNVIYQIDANRAGGRSGGVT